MIGDMVKVINFDASPYARILYANCSDLEAEMLCMLSGFMKAQVDRFKDYRTDIHNLRAAPLHLKDGPAAWKHDEAEVLRFASFQWS